MSYFIRKRVLCFIVYPKIVNLYLFFVEIEKILKFSTGHYDQIPTANEINALYIRLARALFSLGYTFFETWFQRHNLLEHNFIGSLSKTSKLHIIQNIKYPYKKKIIKHRGLFSLQIQKLRFQFTTLYV